MLIQDRFTTAYRGLRSNISRTLLTILGIVIGITAIILVTAIGQGAQELILAQVRGLGSQTIVIEPGREPDGPSSFSELYTDSLKERDLEALENPSNVQGITNITPMIIQVVPMTFEQETIRASILGSSELIADVLDVEVEAGGLITDEDVRQVSAVVVLGAEVKKKLFGASDAVGEKMKIKDKSYRVIGVLEPKGQAAFLNVDELAIIPYTTAQRYVSGTEHFGAIFVSAEDENGLDRAVADIKATLREIHGIEDPSKDDFHVTTQADAIETVSLITDILTALLAAVAAISLVVGGIGIMNIMLVTVSERTREIGLRKALGATDGDVMFQFLLESVILTGLGGLVGVLLGASLAFLASVVLSNALDVEWVFAFPVSGALLGLAVSSGVGLIFGLYPARKASQKSPMEALRYE